MGTVQTPKPTPPNYLAPSDAPTIIIPSKSCADSPLRFRILNQDGKNIRRTCDWVARRETRNRCALAGASETCPRTCETCGMCVDSPLRIKMLKLGTGSLTRSCEWAARI